MKNIILSKSLRLTLIMFLLSGMLVMPQMSVKAAPNTPVNANFEQGRNVGWQESSSNQAEIVWNPSQHGGFPTAAHGGSWMAYLGDLDNEVSRVWQTVTIAPNTHMDFWFWINVDTSPGAPPCGSDSGYVFFNSTIISSWGLCGSDTGGWVLASLDLSAYAGQTGDLEFRTVSDSAGISGLLVDDVVFYDTFTDVSLSDPFLPYIKSLANAGITAGCSITPPQYCPTGAVTRAQMAIFLERGIQGSSYSPPAVGGSTGFGDVASNYWAAAWIKQLAADGITAGCGSGNYCPEGVVTRAQMAVFLLRSKYGAGYTPPAVGSSTGFGDVPPSYWAAAWIKQLVTEGITAGCATGSYCPESPVTRGQMAVFLVRTFSLP